MAFNVTQHLVTVFQSIEDLKLFTEAAHNPFTEVQLVYISIQIPENSHEFKIGLLN